MLLVAMGAPVLFGTAGMGVDMAQYYTWKREAQYAVDQSALAGAWARGNEVDIDGAKERASQEFYVNLSVTQDYLLTHEADEADYDGGSANSILAKATVSASLPFTEIVLGKGMTIAVQAQAIWQTTQQYTACLYALDPTSARTMWFNGGPEVDAACGVGARSTADGAIVTDGNTGPQNINWVVAGGTINDGANAFGNSEVVENYANMVDPWEGLTPPDNTDDREVPDDCNGSANEATWTADEAKSQTVTYKYYRGSNKNTATIMADGYTGAGAFPETTTTNFPTIVEAEFTREPVDYVSVPAEGSLSQIAGSGPDKIYAQPITVETYTYTNKVDLGNTVTLLPGTYDDNFDITCNVVLAPGVYVLEGVDFNLTGGKSIIGEGVMFVLEDGAGIDLMGGAKVYLTPMTQQELITIAGVSAEDAARLENMLIFEHPDSTGDTGSKITGGAHFDLNGIVYMPNSDVVMSGNMNASAECLMVATGTLKISGTADLETLCPAGKTHDIVVGEGSTRVRLVL
ncbi:Tad domain-containing protein [Qipengyuania sphaerica]|uniref:Tad domain-containing protein n=1 Tax=Qipengyuania sphaerica TaxID=2867243 RepID=UPI001C88C48D|nr:Tad domain-containing protein [Qipengyuania sphaerica]MBX7540639.1 Tad domain-containing protein [Qipengyuania sphaerica]